MVSLGLACGLLIAEALAWNLFLTKKYSKFTQSCFFVTAKLWLLNGQLRYLLPGLRLLVNDCVARVVKYRLVDFKGVFFFFAHIVRNYLAESTSALFFFCVSRIAGKKIAPNAVLDGK